MDITPPEREDEQNEEDVNSVAGLVLYCLANCFVSLLRYGLFIQSNRCASQKIHFQGEFFDLGVFSCVHSLSVHHVQDIYLLQYLDDHN